MTESLNDIEARIRELEACDSDSDNSSQSESSSVEEDSTDSDAFSGYSCDSSDSENSEPSETETDNAKNSTFEHPVTSFDRKAVQVQRKKARLGMSDICFRFLVGRCKLRNCIFRHSALETLSEEERGELVRELRKKPFDAGLGAIVKTLNIPVCKTYSKQGECRFQKCRFWHIESENDARWAGCPFWCALCRKAFTSDIQLREHSNGKLHKNNAAGRH
jgi:hypothetical protein